jgi:hypothetical protein
MAFCDLQPFLKKKIVTVNERLLIYYVIHYINI